MTTIQIAIELNGLQGSLTEWLDCFTSNLVLVGICEEESSEEKRYDIIKYCLVCSKLDFWRDHDIIVPDIWDSIIQYVDSS